MKASVITIIDNDKSRIVADRCIKSAASYGLDVAYFKAFTPESIPLKIASQEEIPIDGFEEQFSRFNNCLAAFLSHYWLWKMTAAGTSPHVIFEHDAVMVSPLPNIIQGDIVNIGKPSYGKWNTPAFLGEGPLTTKPYFPGAHAYYITPKGAQQLIDKAKTAAGPTDVFININNFDNLRELYPFCAEARDSFTTIQNPVGCIAKHNYGENYEII
jgi:GR25 family glycosyltransferase involved in LPS biosynthesis